MIYGLDNNGKKIVAAPYANAVCPVCKSNLISKYCTFRWKHAKKSIAYAKKPVYLDLGNGKLFQLKKMYPSTPCGGKGYIRDKEEFIDRLKG